MRVFVAEDEVIVAMALEDMLVELGHSVVGPAASLAQARELSEAAEFDAALIDVNLNGEYSYELAALLRDKGVPFAFVTGYGQAALDQGRIRAPLLTKPYRLDALARLLAQLARS